MEFFEEIINDIQKEYKRNSNNLGWRFLLTSKETFLRNNGILFITLNPGGKICREPVESCEEGCAYLVESWKGYPPGNSPLQKQFQLVFKEIAIHNSRPDFKKVLESAVCAYFIPFKSPTLKSLNDLSGSLRFSKRLWTKILSRLTFQLIICIDKETYSNISQILHEVEYHLKSEQPFSIGWGKYTADVSIFERNTSKTVLVRFPHLSRFRIFGREKSKVFIETIMNEILKTYRLPSDT